MELILDLAKAAVNLVIDQLVEAYINLFDE